MSGTAGAGRNRRTFPNARSRNRVVRERITVDGIARDDLHPDEGNTLMFLLTVALALSAGAGDISPYGLQTSPLPPPPPHAAPRPASPYGIIRHDAPPVVPMLP